MRWVVTSVLLALACRERSGRRQGFRKKAKSGADKPANFPPGVTLNACGCYAKGDGCVCTNKKAQCACPGECEPAGCDEKRNKALEKEYSDAVKHAQDEDKKREEAPQKKKQDAEKKRLAEAAEAERSAPRKKRRPIRLRQRHQRARARSAGAGDKAARRGRQVPRRRPVRRIRETRGEAGQEVRQESSRTPPRRRSAVHAVARPLSRGGRRFADASPMCRSTA